MTIRIVRLDAREGHFQIYLDADPNDDSPGIALLQDDDGNEYETVSGFKGGTRSNAMLWIGGFSTQAQKWDVEFKNIRVIRSK